MSDDPPKASQYHLLPGIGVVIDDQMDADAGGDAIHNLVAQLEKYGIPLVKYKQLPDDKAVAALSNAAFILLDWELFGRPEAENGEAGRVSVGEALEAENRKQIIAFLKKLKTACFAPVFILSNQDTTYIKRVLDEEKILQDPSPGAHVFVEAKIGLKTSDPQHESPLLVKISKWIASHPSLYLIAQWRRKIDGAQTSLFWDLFEASPGWPKALWNASKDDGDDPDFALCEILIRSIKGQMEPLGLSEELVLGSSAPDPGQSELRAILERTTVIPNSRLPVGKYGCGDILRGEADGNPYYRLNIRCDCDCIARGDQDAVELYVLKAAVVSEDRLKEESIFSADTGFARPMNRAYVFPVDQGKCLSVHFADLIPITVKEIRDKGLQRIGRLTSPHLTDIRHRYSNWLHREGFPKIPVLAVRSV
jgi:hypothetical protein